MQDHQCQSALRSGRHRFALGIQQRLLGVLCTAKASCTLKDYGSDALFAARTFSLRSKHIKPISGFLSEFPKNLLDVFWRNLRTEKHPTYLFLSTLTCFSENITSSCAWCFFYLPSSFAVRVFFFFFGIVRIFWVLMLCHNAHLGSSLSAAVRSFGLAWRLLAQENLPTGNKKLTLIRPTLVTWQHAGYI